MPEMTPVAPTDPAEPMKDLLQYAIELLRRGEAGAAGSRALNSATTAFILDRLYFSEFRIREQLSSGPAGERINILGRKGPSTGAPLWLVGQTGAGVPPVPASWQHVEGEPTEARRDSKTHRLVGFGAQSGKLDVLLKILAASKIPAEQLAQPVLVAAVSGEEGLGSGAPMLLGPSDRNQGFALIHGPTACGLWHRHPGCLVLQLHLERRRRHRRMPPHAGFWEFRYETRSTHLLSAQAPEEPDALTVGLAVIDALMAHGDIRILEFSAGETANRRPARCFIRVATSYETPPPLHHIHPSIAVAPIPEGTGLPLPVDRLFHGWRRAHAAGVEAIDGRSGVSRNAPDARPPMEMATARLVSDRDTVSGDIIMWTGAGIDHEDLCERFANAAQAALTGEDEIEIELRVLIDRPAFDVTEGSETITASARRALEASGREAPVGGGLATTDAGLFRQFGIETLVFGTSGPLEFFYNDREGIGIEKLELALQVYERAILDLAGKR
jgi:acetylornithine deacetylase/succinyl-diaminopimelate desuccinylase-like protein